MGAGRGTGKRNGQPPLATEQYSELNATFYSSGGPHEYIRARLQSIIFTLSDADEAEAILQQDLSIGTMQAGGSRRLSQEVRQRYALMESTVLIHHAGEALLRLWMAHKDSPSCPWLEVASLTTPRVFKEEAEKHTSDAGRIPRSTIASVFLGGNTREDAHVEMTEGQWERSIDGFQELLRLVAHTITSEATLYNAAKHGLVGLPGDQADIVYEGKRVAGGGGITFLERTPDNTKFRSGPHSWWLTTSFTNLEANLFLIELTVRAISSLWAVARRRYLGVPGEVVLVSLDEVLTAVAMGPIADNRMLSSFSESLVTYTYESGLQQFGQRVHRPSLIRLGPDVVEAFDRVSGEHVPMTFVALPLREQDKRTPSTSNRQFFRSSPPGSSSV